MAVKSGRKKAKSAKKPSAKSGLSIEQQDELFWREQQKRLGRQLGQPCCSLSGMASLLVGMRGDFAVVIHGERCCTNCFVHTQGPSGARFYNTRITDKQFTMGKTAEPLRRCLRAVIGRKSPEAVFVLGNCLMEMIHDDFEAVAREVRTETGTPVLALRTHGLKAGSQAEMIDWLYSTLASLAEKRRTRTDKKRLNLIGLPDINHEATREQLERVLGAAGIEINGSYPFESTLDDWKRIGEADASFVVDKSLFPRLLARLEEIGVPSVEVPLPVGLGPTVKFLDVIGKHFEAQDRIEKATDKDVSRVRSRIEDFKASYGGMRCAVGLRMVNNYRADQLAYDGLGDLALFLETGFEPTLFIQGPPEEKARRHFQERLHQLGCYLPFHVFPDPIHLPGLLAAGRFDVAYLADHAKGEARKAGVPLIRSRSLEPFFDGAMRNIDYLDQVLDEIRREGTPRRVA